MQASAVYSPKTTMLLKNIKYCCYHRQFLWLCVVILLSLESHAQPQVDVYWDPSNRADTVIDFGVTLVGSPTTRTFSIHNKGGTPVSIPQTDPEAEPFLILENRPGVPVQAPFVEEFLMMSPLTFTVAPGETKSFLVQYSALAGRADLPPDEVNECILTIRIVDSTNILGPYVQKVFRLRALKTTRILATTQQTVDFDSVYVNPQPLDAAGELWPVVNVLDRSVGIVSQYLSMITPLVGNPELVVSYLPGVVFSPKSSIMWAMHYRPHNMGRDSAYFVLGFKPDSTARADSVVTLLSGIGVRQKVNIYSVRGNPKSVAVRGDTIDVGDVAADGRSQTITVVLQNTGNINVNAIIDSIAGASAYGSDVSLVRSVRKLAPSWLPATFDTVEILLRPAIAGTYYMRYECTTDLNQRSIRGIPDGEATFGFHILARGVRPVARVYPQSLDFGSLTHLPGCPSTTSKALSVANLGNITLVVDSIVVSNAPDVNVNVNMLNVTPGNEGSFEVLYLPRQFGDFAGTITLFTNSMPANLVIPIIGSYLRPDTVVLQLPGAMSIRPGTPIDIPIYVEKGQVSRAETVALKLSYNPSLMSPAGVETIGTAVEGATAGFVSISPGLTELKIQGFERFYERNVLCVMRWNTYLGDRNQDGVAIVADQSTIGNKDCPDMFRIQGTSTLIRSDSICGLPFLRVVDSRPPSFIRLYPQPAHENITLEFSIHTAAPDVRIQYQDLQGRLLYETYLGSFPVGTYVVEQMVPDHTNGILGVRIVDTQLGISQPLLMFRK